MKVLPKIKLWIKSHPKKVEGIGILILIIVNIIWSHRILAVYSIILMWYAILRLRLFMERKHIQDDGRFLW